MDKSTFIGLADTYTAVWRHPNLDTNEPVDFFTAVDLGSDTMLDEDVVRCEVTLGSVILADKYSIHDDEQMNFLKHMAIERVWDGIKSEFCSVTISELEHECAVMGIPYGMAWHLLNRIGVRVVE